MISKKIMFGWCIKRKFSQMPKNNVWNAMRSPEFDIDYLCSSQNLQEIAENIAARKGIGDISLVQQLKHKLDGLNPQEECYAAIQKQFHLELLKIPNRTHPKVATYKDEPRVVREVGSKQKPDMAVKEFHEITKRLKLVRTDQLGNLSGNKSYYLLGEMAELEHALINYIVNILMKNKFQLIMVPDILSRDVIEGCGMNTRTSRTQVYTLDERLHGPDLCLSGTSELALAGYLSGRTLSRDELPLKLAAVSRCYRAETSNLLEERGIYRVHEFNKVEMFVVSSPESSDEMLEQIRTIQEESFASLGLHFKVLDMPPSELGAQSYRKYDIEAWLSGRQIYGEISSCSNCLDYQSRRLGVRFRKGDDTVFVHTLNGTACAIPRLLIAIVEAGQQKNGTVTIPQVLHKYMGKNVIGKQKKVPELKLIKNKK